MKNYTITVNGNVYDVTVEEKGETTAGTAPAPTPAPKAAPTPAPKAAPAPAPKAPVAGNQGSIKLNSPMPGKILAIKASVGQNVKRGDVVLILEAMKMENEIVATSDGSIVSVDVAVGDMVEAGDVLATLK